MKKTETHLHQSPGLNDRRREERMQSLIQAGLVLFGEMGLQGASTRDLARKAGTNVSAISYYFGSKQGLYEAVISHILVRMDRLAGDSLRRVSEMAASEHIDSHEARIVIKQLMHRFAELLVNSEEPGQWAQILIREQFEPGPAFEIFHQSPQGQLAQHLSPLVAVIMGVDRESNDARIHSQLIFGQLFSFLVQKESMLRLFNVKKLTSNHLESLHQILNLHIDACLDLNRKKGN